MLRENGCSVIVVLVSLACACALDNPNFDGGKTGGGETEGESSGTEGSGTDSMSSSSGSTGSSGETSSSNICGDGSVAVAEQCDDGNKNSGDGCSQYCNVEPSGVEVVDDESWTMLAGMNENLSQETMVCGNVLIGFEGFLEMGPSVPCNISLGCSVLGLNGLDIELSEPIVAGVFAKCLKSEEPWSRFCGEHQVVVGVSGKFVGIVQELVFRCATIAIVEDSLEEETPFSISIGPSVDLEPVGGAPDNGDFGPYDCPSGSVAVGAIFFSNGGDVHGFKLKCKPLMLTFP